MSPTGISTPKDLLNYFNTLQGKGIVSGEFIETGDPASATTGPLATLQSETGQYVGMIGLDYWHFGSGGAAITADANADAIANWQAGGLVEVSPSIPNPTTGGGSSDTSRLDVAGLLTAGTATNTAFNNSLSQVAAGLLQLQNAGVVAIFRPFWENNGNWFWWGAGELSATQFQALWQYTYNYMTNTMGLHNLVWEYAINAGTALSGRSMTDTYPGSAYVDMTAQDIYSDQPGSNGQATYQALEALGKPTALGEFGSGGPSGGDDSFSMPSLISQIQTYMPNTVYWLQWWSQNSGGNGWGMEQDQNTSAALNDGYVVNRGEINNTSTSSAATPMPTPTASINDTVVLGTSGSITDASGNVWTISSSEQVAVNGIIEPTTANVIELAYVNGTIWHENSGDFWYGKTTPSAAWAPGNGTLTSPLPAASTSVSSAPSVMKVMALGDSIVEGVVPGGWRAPLYTLLTNAGFNVQMVGDQTSNPGGGLPSNEDNHEGIGGVTSEQVEAYIDQNNIIATYTPNVIVLSCGGNDMYGVEGDTPQQAYASMVSLVTDILSKLPGVEIVVGTLPPVQGDPATTSATELGQFNLLLPGLASISSHISVVNVTPVISVAADLGSDGIHPNVAGNALIAGVFAAGVEADFSTTTTTPTPVPTPTSTASANDTVVMAGSSGSITDSSGNAWTITSGGQVAVNGVTDTTTGGVIELAYVNSTIWQENGNHLWWGKAQPSASWGPSSGTISPLPATATPTTTPTPTSTASVNDTVVLAGSSGAITDSSGNAWTITSGGQVAVNGVTDTTTGGVIELAYVNSTIWQENGNHLWWGKAQPSASWGPSSGTVSPLPATPAPTPTATQGTITLNISEDAWLGDAQFIVTVDGTQVSGTQTSSVLHSSGDTGVFTLTGNWSTGAHNVQVQFINDAYGGTASTDRNLYVDSIAFNGTTETATTATMDGNGTTNFTVGGATAAASAPADMLTLNLAEDAWNGNAQFTLSVDGKQVSTAQDVVASHSAGAWEALSFAGAFGAGSHTIGITFTNDAYGGTPSTDRNLYINGIDLNGQHYGTGINTLYGNGTQTFNVTTTH